MKKTLNHTIGILLFSLFIASFTMSVRAENNRALERAQYMLRQLNAQKTQFEKLNIKLGVDLKKLKKIVKNQVRKQRLSNKNFARINSQKNAYIKKLQDKLRQTFIIFRKSEAERLQANTNGKALSNELRQCVVNNHSLVKINDTLLKKYNNKSALDALEQAEPFTRIKQVKIENMMQTYRFKSEDLKVNPGVGYKQSGAVVSNASHDGNG